MFRIKLTFSKKKQIKMINQNEIAKRKYYHACHVYKNKVNRFFSRNKYQVKIYILS